MHKHISQMETLYPAHAAGYLFPDLYPAGGQSGQTEAAERVMREESEALGKLSE